MSVPSIRNNDLAACEQRDLDRGSPLPRLFLWWIPFGIILATTITINGHNLSFMLRGVLLIIATLWFGVSCYVNGRGCGRVHCKIDGIAMPLLAVIGLLNLVKLISINWDVYVVIFFIVLALSYVPEWFGTKYANSTIRNKQ